MCKRIGGFIHAVNGEFSWFSSKELAELVELVEILHERGSDVYGWFYGSEYVFHR